MSNIFAPDNLSEFVGQIQTKKLVEVAIAASIKEERRLPNILFAGSFGLGKTTLAKLTIEASGAKLNLMDGMNADKNPPSQGTVLIDEIHNLSPASSDYLSSRIDSSALTIIAATTSPGSLSPAFRSRFRIYHLHDYTTQELITIARHICMKKAVGANLPVLRKVALRSRNNARALTTNLSTIFDMMTVHNKYFMDNAIIEQTFKLLGLDADGLFPRDREYLSSLPERAVGISYLSAKLGIDKDTIEEEIEPYLLRKGLIDRTPKGRIKL